MARSAEGAREATAAIQALEDGKRGLSSQIIDLQSQLEKAKAELQAATKSNASAEQQIADLHTRLEKAQAGLEATASAKASVDKHLADIRAQLEKAQMDASAALGARARLEAEVKARDSDVAQLRTTLDSHLQQSESLKAETISLNARAEQFNVDLAAAQRLNSLELS